MQLATEAKSSMIDPELACSGHKGMAEADHRIANHLAILGSYVRLKSAELIRRNTDLSAADVSLLLTAVGSQISAISHLHRLLSADESQDTADLGAHLQKICASMRSAVLQDVVIIETIGEDCNLPMNKIIAAAQIFTEVITNAIKYGHHSGESGFIEVSCKRDSRGEIVVNVQDNGPGLPECQGTRPAAGLGFRLVEGLAAQIGGTVDYTSSDLGLNVRLTVGTANVRDTPFDGRATIVPARVRRVKIGA
jgi:two-component sensor histidine kinase